MTTTSKSIRFFVLSLFVISCCSSVFSFTNGKPTPVTDDELLAQLFMKTPSPYYRQFTYLYGQDVFETIIQDSEDCKGILQQLDGSRAINTHLTLTFLARQYPTVYAQVQKASLWEAIPASRLTYLLISRLQRLIKAETLRSASILRKGPVQEQKAILRNLEQIQKFISSLYEEISIENKFIELVSYYADLKNQDTVKQVLQKSKSNNPKISSLISDEFVQIFHIDRSTLKVSLTSQSQTSKTESENPEKSSNSNLVSAEEQCVKNSNLQQIKLAQNLYSGNKKVTWSELQEIQKQTLSNQQAGVIFFKNIESSFSTGLLGKSGSKINQYKNVKLVSSKGEVIYDCTHTVIIISQADKSIVTFL